MKSVIFHASLTYTTYCIIIISQLEVEVIVEEEGGSSVVGMLLRAVVSRMNMKIRKSVHQRETNEPLTIDQQFLSTSGAESKEWYTGTCISFTQGKNRGFL